MSSNELRLAVTVTRPVRGSIAALICPCVEIDTPWPTLRLTFTLSLPVVLVGISGILLVCFAEDTFLLNV